MLAYPVMMKKDTNGARLVTFPDIPEAATSAHNEAKRWVMRWNPSKARSNSILKSDAP